VRIWEASAYSDQNSTLPDDPNLLQSTPGTIVAVIDDAILVRGDGYIALKQLQWPGKKAQAAHQFSQGHELIGQQFT